MGVVEEFKLFVGSCQVNGSRRLRRSDEFFPDPVGEDRVCVDRLNRYK